MKKTLVFVVNVGLFLLHFSLGEQIPDVPFLEEPFEENFEYFDDSCILGVFRIEKNLKMTWTCNSFNFLSVKILASFNTHFLLFAQIFNLGEESVSNELSDDLFGDIPTDVFTVVFSLFMALLALLLQVLLLFHVEDM